MRRLRRAGQFFAPAPGLYIPIPSEFSGGIVVPAMDFIDQLMTFLGRSYYVGLLSAAELHGAAHQRPQVFQVMVDRIVADRDIARVRLRFYQLARLGDVPVVLKNSRTRAGAGVLAGGDSVRPCGTAPRRWWAIQRRHRHRRPA